jgi:UDP-N-acetylglucosamine 2-epimerase (non-hydrolysing)
METVEIGANALTGFDKDKITRAISDARDRELKQKISEMKNPYGDGNASQRINDIILSHI